MPPAKPLKRPREPSQRPLIHDPSNVAGWATASALSRQRSLVNYSASALRGPRSLVNYAGTALPRPRSLLNYTAFAPPKQRSLVNFAASALRGPRSLVNYTASALPWPRSLINNSASALPEPPGRPGAPRPLKFKFCKTCVSLETTSRIRRAGRAILERARTKSMFSNAKHSAPFVSRWKTKVCGPRY